MKSWTQKIFIKIGSISPFWKKSIASCIFLAIAGYVTAPQFSNKKSFLNRLSQEKVDNLSSLERVKAQYERQKIQQDPISDVITQNLRKKLENTDEIPNSSNSNGTNYQNVKNSSKNLNSKCDPYSEALGDCIMEDIYKTDVKSLAHQISSQTKPIYSDENIDTNIQINTSNLKNMKVDYEDIPGYADFKNPNYNEKKSSNSGFSLLLASTNQTEILSGRTVDIGGASHQIKAGTTVLAVLNEAKTVTSSGEQYASASIIGAPFDNKKFPDGITVLLKLKLNGTQDGIEGSVISCSSKRNNDKSILCFGQLEDINGENALRGEVYSNTGWRIVTTAATTFLAGLSLSKITTSATEIGVTVDQTTTNALYQALSGAIVSMGSEIAASFARSGTQISIPGRVVVRILFTKDSVW